MQYGQSQRQILRRLPPWQWPAVSRISAIALGALLAGCAAFSPDGGMSAVQDIAGAALEKQVVALRSPDDADVARDRVRRLLKAPLSADGAVQVALLNNRDLQASYNSLGISEAAMVEATLPPNPTISVSHIIGGGGLEFERQIVGEILALATLPARAEIAADRFRQAQLETILDVLRIAAETRQAYYRAVGARALVGFLTQAQSTAETATQLSKRLGESGAQNKLDQARNQVFYAELTAQLANARRRTVEDRERLIRLVGLWGSDLNFRLQNALPPLPARPRSWTTVEVAAVSQRVDLQVARIEVAALAKSYGLTEATRFLNLLNVSGISKTAREPGGNRFEERGVAAELQVPLFDFGEVRMRQAEETYMQAVNHLVAQAVNVRSEAREAYQGYRSAYDLARHYKCEVLPLRQIISHETLLRYNAMQIDVFSLLAEARERIASTVTSIQAEQDFWLAVVNLEVAVVGGRASAPGRTATTPIMARQTAGNQEQ
jgi:outer membrane protein TolC